MKGSRYLISALIIILISLQSVNANNEITFILTTEESTTLSDYEGYLLVDAMATWCMPCRVEMLHLATIYDKIENNDDIDLISLSVDQDLDTLDDVKQMKIDFEAEWDFGYDEFTLFNQTYEIYGYPTLLLLNPEKQIIKTWLGLTEADEVLKELDTHITGISGQTFRFIQRNWIYFVSGTIILGIIVFISHNKIRNIGRKKDFSNHS
jgi:thiol-disulfide isomerase/thioredoxin